VTRPTPRFITRWDLDKTYLRSHFDTLSDLMSSAFERATDKRTVPGATAVLRELGVAGGRVHLLSGSPRQMRRKLEAKLKLDGVSWDELTLKPNLDNLLKLRLRDLRDQLGYKLPELLDARVREEQRFGAGTEREVLVGDDSESDAFVYSLYADLCSGRVARGELVRVLEAGETRTSVAERCLAALDRLVQSARIDCILIHLDGQSPPSLFSRYGSRVIPFYNYLQAALVLLERDFLDAEGTLRIAAEFHASLGFSADAITRSYQDLARRGHASGTARNKLAAALAVGSAALPSETARELAAALDAINYDRDSMVPRSIMPSADYVELAALHRGGKNRRRVGQRFR
jgi:hypothetical protein